MRDEFILQLTPSWAIFADHNQWIVAKAEKARPQDDLSHPAVRWRGVSFIGSTKTVLYRVVREKRIAIDTDAKAIIDSWPESFLDWRDRQNAERRVA